jgi:hypothetical protein
MTLTDTQLVLLSAASRREDGAIVLTANLKGSAAGKVIGKLLRDGLVEEVPAGASMPVCAVMLTQDRSRSASLQEVSRALDLRAT